jgi:hypothetical protein
VLVQEIAQPLVKVTDATGVTATELVARVNASVIISLVLEPESAIWDPFPVKLGIFPFEALPLIVISFQAASAVETMSTAAILIKSSFFIVIVLYCIAVHIVTVASIPIFSVITK